MAKKAKKIVYARKIDLQEITPITGFLDEATVFMFRAAIYEVVRENNLILLGN